ncbi:MAG: glycosyltransferase [Candidatus Eisenbacteria bacterium]|nr:glycosyltransferase [Candidatus Eisenbacteria bacterium]
MDLVVLSEVRWGYFRTRKQFLLSRFPPRWRVFYAQPPASGADDPWEPRTEGNVTYFTVPFLKPSTASSIYNTLSRAAPGRAAIETAAEWFLRSRLRKLGVEACPAVMVSNIYCPGALSRLSRKLIFYDFNDHPLQFAGVPSWARRYWRATLDQVDTLFVVSEYYRRELAAQIQRPPVLIGNGVECARFEAPNEAPADLERLPRPRIGYIGLLSHFLDFETLEALRRGRGTGTLVLIGPGTRATETRVAELVKRGGVAVLGPRAYDRVPAYLQHLDVGVIPFRANDPFVQGINPNKVYQYLASGLPVVTTPLLDLEPAPPHLQFASTPDQAVDAVRAALASPADAAARRSLARPHDWDALAERMVATLESRLSTVS